MKRAVFIPPHPTDNCARKTRFTSEIAARMGGQATLTFPGRVSDQERVWVYACEYCLGWHFTQRPNDLPAVTKRELVEGALAAALGAQHGRAAPERGNAQPHFPKPVSPGNGTVSDIPSLSGDGAERNNHGTR